MSSPSIRWSALPVLVSLLFVHGAPLPVQSQNLTRYNPMPWSIRACAASPNFDEIYVGDSGFYLHLVNQTWSGTNRFSVPFMFRAASYPDAKHVVLAGDTGLVIYLWFRGLYGGRPI